MSEALIAIVIICATVLVVTLIICVTQIHLNKQDEASEKRPDSGWTVPMEARSELWRDVEEHLQESVQEPEPVVEKARESASKPEAELDMSKMAALPFDKENPPSTYVYNPRSEIQGDVPKCFCHKRSLTRGQVVIMWPMKDSPEVRIFCQEALS